ncbi:hypothetical protein HN51_047562, partial [Arachis hypogaea]
FLEVANTGYLSSQYQFANLIGSVAGSSWSAFSCGVKFFSRQEASCMRSMIDKDGSPLLSLPVVAFPFPFLCEFDILKNRKPGYNKNRKTNRQIVKRNTKWQRRIRM